MSSISILPNPKAYANPNFNKVQLYALQDLTNPVAGNILVSDASGNFTSQTGAGAGFVTAVVPADISISTTSVTPGVVQVGATGMFAGKNIITSGTLGAGVSTLGNTTVGTLGAGASTLGNTTVGSLGSNGNVNLNGPQFKLNQATASTAFVNPVTVVTCNGTSGIITLTGFSLATAQTFTIQVTNSSVTANSVVTAVVNESALNHTGLMLGVAGLSGGFSVNVSNYSQLTTGGATTITGTFMLNFTLS